MGPIFSFGKYEGYYVSHIVRRDRRYITWMLSVKDPSKPMAEACEEPWRI